MFARLQSAVHALFIFSLASCFSLCQAQISPPPICPTTSNTNTDCAFIITISPGGAITGAAVPNAQPYDGAEDALVGIVNMSGKPFTGSFTITGSFFGEGIFAFDGDGICTYIGPGGFRPSPMGTYCSANDVFGLDPGDYAGPKVTFSNITGTFLPADTGTVTVTGLANGASTFFSIEGPPAAIQAAGGIPITQPLTVTGANLGSITLGGTISGSLSVVGGAPPYTYAVTGATPSGITVTGAAISGTATQTGPFNVNFTVTDSLGASAAGSISYTVVPPSVPLKVSGVNLGQITLGSAVSGSISVVGGAAPYMYAVSGSLPSGIKVNGSPDQRYTYPDRLVQRGFNCHRFRRRVRDRLVHLYRRCPDGTPEGLGRQSGPDHFGFCNLRQRLCRRGRSSLYVCSERIRAFRHHRKRRPRQRHTQADRLLQLGFYSHRFRWGFRRRLRDLHRCQTVRASTRRKRR